MQLANNTILITGGGSGIGLGLAERFLKENNTVIICGRRADVLADVAQKHPGIITKTADLQHEAGRNELYGWVAEHYPQTNVLVNNAGIQNWMNVTDTDFYPKAMAEINTNIAAPIHLTSLFLQLKGLTTIINVTSGLAFVQLTKVPVYCATKAFFHSFTLSLRHLLQQRGVEVIEMIPPALNTDLGGKGLHDGQPPVSAFVDAMFAQMKEGKTELTFGFSEVMATAGPEKIKEVFGMMNP